MFSIQSANGCAFICALDGNEMKGSKTKVDCCLSPFFSRWLIRETEHPIRVLTHAKDSDGPNTDSTISSEVSPMSGTHQTN